MDLQQIVTYATTVAREAGAILMEGFRQHKQIDRKSSSVDLVTQYDKAVEALISDKLIAAYPEHAIVGEEGSEREGNGRYRWYVDPLDGTNNFAHGFPIFAVSMALYDGERPLVGVVYDPTRDECFTAVANGGAWLTEHNREPIQLAVSDMDALGSSLLATGFPYDRQTSPQNNIRETEAFLKTALGIRRPGSAALDMCYVAAGRLDGYWEYKLYCWDMGAARLIAEEAGGRVTKIDGSPVTMEPRQMSLIVSNGRIHQQMLDVIVGVNRKQHG